jgi:hypothetical protein
VRLCDVFDSGRSLEAVLGELACRCQRNLPEPDGRAAR